MAGTMRPRHWPARRTQNHGSIFYQVPMAVRDQWDGKQWFLLGKTEPEAWATWLERHKEAGAADEVLPKAISQAIDSYMRATCPPRL